LKAAKIEFILNSFVSFQVLLSTIFLPKIILAAFTAVSNSRSFARNIAGLLMLPLCVFTVSHFSVVRHMIAFYNLFRLSFLENIVVSVAFILMLFFETK